MRKCRVLLAFLLAFAATPLSVHAGKNPIHEQQAAMAREQQMMLQQEKKMMEQQQKAMQQQYQQMLRQHQQMMQQQQKALANEQKQAQIKAQQAKTTTASPNTVKPKTTASATSSASTSASTTTTNATTATKENAKSTTSTTAAASTSTATAKTHATSLRGSSHGLLRWPHSSTTAYRHLMQLKHSLDAISHKSTPTTRQVSTLRTSLLNVVQNSPRPPSTHVQQFSSHLATALASRSSAQVDTKDLALSLRAAMNSIHLSADEGAQTLANTQQLLSNAGVSTAHVSTVTGDIEFMANEVQASLR